MTRSPHTRIPLWLNAIQPLFSTVAHIMYTKGRVDGVALPVICLLYATAVTLAGASVVLVLQYRDGLVWAPACNVVVLLCLFAAFAYQYVNRRSSL